MIGMLRGLLVDKGESEVIVDVQGVGYEVFLPLTAQARLPTAGEQVRLYTHLVVRDDAHTLFGFVSRRERDLFRELIKVSGVGPRMGINILSGVDADEFSRLIDQGDTRALMRLPGVGRKTAERLLVDMPDRLAQWRRVSDSTPATTPAPAGPSRQDRLAEAEEALVALGYRPQQASRAVAAVDDGEAASEELIRRALRSMVRG